MWLRLTLMCSVCVAAFEYVQRTFLVEPLPWYLLAIVYGLIAFNVILLSWESRQRLRPRCVSYARPRCSMTRDALWTGTARISVDAIKWWRIAPDTESGMDFLEVQLQLGIRRIAAPRGWRLGRLIAALSDQVEVYDEHRHQELRSDLPKRTVRRLWFCAFAPTVLVAAVVLVAYAARAVSEPAAVGFAVAISLTSSVVGSVAWYWHERAALNSAQRVPAIATAAVAAIFSFYFGVAVLSFGAIAVDRLAR